MEACKHCQERLPPAIEVIAIAVIDHIAIAIEARKSRQALMSALRSLSEGSASNRRRHPYG